jgi:hypothetical protein
MFEQLLYGYSSFASLAYQCASLVPGPLSFVRYPTRFWLPLSLAFRDSLMLKLCTIAALAIIRQKEARVKGLCSIAYRDSGLWLNVGLFYLTSRLQYSC